MYQLSAFILQHTVTEETSNRRNLYNSDHIGSNVEHQQ